MAATYPFSKFSDANPREGQNVQSIRPVPDDQRRHFSLLLRLTLFNLLAVALLVAAWWEGLVALVIEADQTRLTVLIAVVFVVGFVISIRRAVEIGQDIDRLQALNFELSDTHEQPVNTPTSIGALRLRLTHRIASVRHIANALVLLGLIGTVLGFIIALSGVNPDTASDVNSIAPMVSTLIQGMSTALYTTLVGSVLNVWLTVNYQMLASGTVELMSLWLERAERLQKAEAVSDNA